MKLKFLPEAGHSMLSGQGQQMAMVAGARDALGEVSNYLNTEQSEGLFSTGAGCDWQSLPIMIGSKMYELKTTIPGTDNPIFGMTLMIPGHPVAVCIRQDGSVAASDVLGIDCRTPAREVDGDGDMKMTLIVKFQSPQSGTGVLLFEGKSGQHSFFAKAPVTMSR